MRGPTNTTVLTHSELNVLHACAHKHKLRYELQLEPAGGIDDSGPLRVGSLVHLGIAEVYKAIQQVQLVRLRPTKAHLHEVVRQKLQEAVDEATATESMFVGESADEYAAKSAEDIDVATKCLDLFVEHIAIPGCDRYDVLGVEVPFRVPLLTEKGRRSGDELEGVFDLVLFDRALRTIPLGENKTSIGDAHAYEARLQHDPQAPLYVYALRQMFGWRVKGEVVLNVIRKSYPREPNINKDGTVSVAEIDTTREVYGRALEMQTEPDYLTKARDALDELNATGAHEGKSPSLDQKKCAKALEALTKAQARWAEAQAKQAGRLAALPGIERFVAQHESRVSDEMVDRAARDAWTGARLIRLFRRGELTPWRNGTACRAFNRLCSYHAACVDDVIEEGELLRKRSARHPEVEEAESTDLARMLEVFDAFVR